MLEFRIKEDGSSSTVNGVTRYSLEFAFERISSGTYDLVDYRVRGFFNHHYVLTALNDNGYYAIKDIQPFQGVGGSMTEGYDDWMNDIRPPRIDENKFASEVILYLPDRTIDSSTPLASQGRFNLRGVWLDTDRLGRYNDTESSYSFIGLSGETYTNPMNWVFEKRDNTKTRSISNISSSGNTVTVITSSGHPYNTGDAVRITGIGSGVRSFGNAGERYEGTFKITVTGANTFTYRTKHVVNASTHTTGTIEFWEVVVNEQSISTIEGDGNGLITIDTSRPHDLQIDDIISIEGTTNYNASQVIVTNRISSTSIQCQIIGNTASTSQSIGSIKYSSRPPSSAIGLNYETGYEAKLIDDHTSFTYLRYADKDTYIDNNVANDFGGSTQLRVRNFSSNLPPSFQRMVFRFPIFGIPLSQLLFAEINAVYETGTDGDAQMTLYQMTSDSWSDSDTWDTINPLIDEGDQIGFYNFINVGSGENDTYTRFTVSTEKLTKWLDGIEPPDVGFVKTATVNSISNVYWSTETIEYKPYIVISSGVVADSVPPTIQLTNSTTSLVLSSVQGDGSGKITLTSISPNNLQAGDLVHVISTNYNSRSAVVLGGADAPTTYTYKIIIADNTSSVFDIGGISFRHNVIDVSALGIDNSEISDDPNDIEIRKTATLTPITPTNIVKSPSTSLTFDFTLSGLDDGIYDLSVKDIVGNQSDRLDAPLVMHYRDNLNHQISELVRSGSVVDIIGFNVDSPLNLVIADSSIMGGVIPGGLTQSIGIGDIDNINNLFTFTIPSGIQAEFNVVSVDDVANTLLIENASFKLNDAVSFNSIGNFMNDPLIIGDLYFIVNVNQIGDDVEIQISSQFGGSPIDLDPPSIDMNMVIYNYVTPAYVIKDGIDSSEYNNFVAICVDDYPPKIYIPDIIGTGDNINIIITDITEIDQSSVSFINGVATLTDDTDPRILTYNVDITGTGIFRVDVADILNNSSFATKLIPAIQTPYIEVVNYIINDANNFILSVHVIDDNIDAIIASDNSSPGIFVEGSIDNVSYGIISNLVSVVDGLTFDITVSGLLDGVMKIYANTNDSASAMLLPPVLTSISEECFTYNTMLNITGINLNHDISTTRTFLNSNMTITVATMTNLTVFFANGTSDGYIPFTLTAVNGGITLISNTITSILDNTPPIITIHGDQVKEVTQGGIYIEEGVTAIDNIFGDVTSSVVIEGTVDTNTYGTYYILYTASDPCGNTNVAIRQVNVVTGCPIYIDVSPKQGYVGDTVTITTTSGLFNPIPINNIVTFNNVVGTVIGGDRNSIQVVVPFGATTGYVQVETGANNTGYGECSLSNVDTFTLLFEDEKFDPERDKLIRDYQKRRQSTTASGLLNPFGRGVDLTAIYNRDMGYSGFTETTDENSMVQNVYTIILTRLGERIFNPQFGTNLESYVHSIIDDVGEFQKNVMNEIVRAVKRYEPRVIIDEDESFVYFDEEINDIVLILHILVPTGNVRVIGLTLKSIRNGEPNV